MSAVRALEDVAHFVLVWLLWPLSKYSKAAVRVLEDACGESKGKNDVEIIFNGSSLEYMEGKE